MLSAGRAMSALRYSALMARSKRMCPAAQAYL